MRHRTALRGDAAATPDKAEFLLRVAREEVAAIKGDSPRDRAKLRQAANKGWIALTTGADSYMLKTEGRTVKNSADVFRVYKQLGSEAVGNAQLAYDGLHIACGYEDRPASCTRDSVKAGFRLAGTALSLLARRMSKKR